MCRSALSIRHKGDAALRVGSTSDALFHLGRMSAPSLDRRPAASVRLVADADESPDPCVRVRILNGRVVVK